MPVFTQSAGASRDLRVQLSRGRPLPRVQDMKDASDVHEFYDVVVAGAGPAGLFLTLLLARYGIGDDRLLCVDGKPGSLKSGQADGIQPRSLEVFKSLGLADEILNEACQMWEVAFWNPDSNGSIVRTSLVPDIGVPARYAQEFTIHQGRLERMFSEDLARYSPRGVEYDTRILSVKIDEQTNNEYPVEIEVEKISSSGQGSSDAAPSIRRIRAKHVVGCDGARSVVRRSVGLELKGETRDHIWGVIDMVADSDFPDLRRRCAIHSDAGSIMIIPRERIPSGDYITRLYVQVNDEVEADGDGATGMEIASEASGAAENISRQKSRARRAQVTFEGLLGQAKAVFRPYKLDVAAGTEIDWWAAYQIGQRMADKFFVPDDKGVPRVFIAGDASHTHSPKAGQGMNVSMMDSYNLAWKLAHTCQGLAKDPTALLESYDTERVKIAAELIDVDHQFSSMFSGKIDHSEESSLTPDQFEQLFRKINGFTTGCGIEYPDSDIVWKSREESPVQGTDFLSGVLEPGRRFFNTRLTRHADSCPWDLQDDLPSEGRFVIVVFARPDLLDPRGVSAKTLETIDKLIDGFPPTIIRLSVIHALEKNIRGIQWNELPPVIKKRAEMRFHSARAGEAPEGHVGSTRKIFEAEDAYSIYGVDKQQGALVVVRPDGYVGALASLEDVARVGQYLSSLLRASSR